MNSSRPLTIYTDGSCSPNPGPGGWTAILTGGKFIKAISAGEPQTTNNRMELIAAIEGLRALAKPSEVLVIADSEYLVKGASEWISAWTARGWKNVKNRDLWEQLVDEMARHTVSWQWVKGHSGNHFNELADKLANDAVKRQTMRVQTLPCPAAPPMLLDSHEVPN